MSKKKEKEDKIGIDAFIRDLEGRHDALMENKKNEDLTVAERLWRLAGHGFGAVNDAAFHAGGSVAKVFMPEEAEDWVSDRADEAGEAIGGILGPLIEEHPRLAGNLAPLLELPGTGTIGALGKAMRNPAARGHLFSGPRNYLPEFYSPGDRPVTRVEQAVMDFGRKHGDKLPDRIPKLGSLKTVKAGLTSPDPVENLGLLRKGKTITKEMAMGGLRGIRDGLSPRSRALYRETGLSGGFQDNLKHRLARIEEPYYSSIAANPDPRLKGKTVVNEPKFSGMGTHMPDEIAAQYAKDAPDYVRNRAGYKKLEGAAQDRKMVADNATREIHKGTANTTYLRHVHDHRNRVGPEHSTFDWFDGQEMVNTRPYTKGGVGEGLAEYGGGMLSPEEAAFIGQYFDDAWKMGQTVKRKGRPGTIKFKRPLSPSGHSAHAEDVLERGPYRSTLSKFFEQHTDLLKSGEGVDMDDLFDYMKKNEKKGKWRVVNPSAEHAKKNGFWLSGSKPGTGITEGGIHWAAKVDERGNITGMMSDKHDFLEKGPLKLVDDVFSDILAVSVPAQKNIASLNTKQFKKAGMSEAEIKALAKATGKPDIPKAPPKTDRDLVSTMREMADAEPSRAGLLKEHGKQAAAYAGVPAATTASQGYADYMSELLKDEDLSEEELDLILKQISGGI